MCDEKKERKKEEIADHNNGRLYGRAALYKYGTVQTRARLYLSKRAHPRRALVVPIPSICLLYAVVRVSRGHVGNSVSAVPNKLVGHTTCVAGTHPIPLPALSPLDTGPITVTQSADLGNFWGECIMAAAHPGRYLSFFLFPFLYIWPGLAMPAVIS